MNKMEKKAKKAFDANKMSVQFEIAIRICLETHSAIEANALYGSQCGVFYWIMNLKKLE